MQAATAGDVEPDMDGFGAEFKKEISQPGGWSMNLGGFGEMLPDEKNRFTLSTTEKDKWGLPVVVFDAAYGDNEKKMRVDMMNDAAEMLEAAGLKNVSKYNDESKHPGIGIHEMGTATYG